MSLGDYLRSFPGHDREHLEQLRTAMDGVARTFAPWVEPIAAGLRAGRTAIAGFARTAPEEIWERPSPLEGWTCKDLLAHLAGDTGKGSTEAIRAAVERRKPDPTPFAAGEDALNARDIEARRVLRVSEIIAEVDADGEGWQELLSRLGEGDQDVRWNGFPWSLGEYLRILVEHDRDHLAELQSVLEGVR